MKGRARRRKHNSSPGRTGNDHAVTHRVRCHGPHLWLPGPGKQRGSARSQKARGRLLEDGEAEAVFVGLGLARFRDDARGSGKQQGKGSGDPTTKCTHGSQESACSLQQNTDDHSQPSNYDKILFLDIAHNALTSLFLLSVNTRLAFPPYKTKTCIKKKDPEAKIMFSMCLDYAWASHFRSFPPQLPAAG